MSDFRLWLDDWRKAPIGWMWATSVSVAKDWLIANEVEEMSLDHDLGACTDCMGGKTIEEWMQSTDFQNAPHCSHVGTGYDLCLWMAETGRWPKTKPRVHSMNPVGRERMQGVIDRYYPEAI